MQLPEPPYLRIVGEIRARIDAGELRAGDRVPSTRQITRDWGVAIATASKVLAELRQQGLVRAVPGVGTVVDDAPATPPRPLRTGHHRTDSGLSRERIVRTAIGIADLDGMAALSIRRIAAELDTAAMTLYRYVPGKDDLVLLMIDTAFGGTPLPDPGPTGWRERLELVARTQWDLCRRHPWLASVISMTRPQLLPHAMLHTEWALRSLSGLGMDAESMLHVVVTLFNYVRGVAVNIEPETEAQQETGLTDEQWLTAQEPAMRQLMAAGGYPTLSGLIAGPELDVNLDSLFDFGLALLLDGLAVRLAARTQPH